MPGASPDNMATNVAAPLERHLGQIADVTEMTSQSSLGTTRITLQFGLDRDIDGAARDVRGGDQRGARRPADQPQAESDLSQGQSGRRADHGAGAHLDDAPDRPALRRRLQHPAAAAVAIAGHRRGRRHRAARCRRCGSSSIRPRSTITASASRTCARRSPPPTPTRPKGQIEDADFNYQIYANDQATKAAQYRDLVIAYRNNARREAQRRRRGRSIRSRICATPGSPTASRRSASCCRANPAPTSSRPSTT